MSARAPNRPSTGTASSVTGTRTTSATTAGREPRPRAAAAARPAPTSEHQRARSTPSCSTHPADQPDQRRRGCSPSRGRAAASAVRRRRATPSDQQREPRRAHHAATSSRPTHLVWQHAGPVGRDQPAREAVVERRAARRRAAAPAGCAGRRRSSPAACVSRSPPARCSDSHDDLAARRGADQVEQVAHRHAGPGRAGAPALDAGDRQRRRGLRHRPQVGQGELHLRGRRTRPSRRYAGAGGAAATPRRGAPTVVDRDALPGPSPDRTPSTETRRSHGHRAAGRREHRDAGGGPGGAQQAAPRHDARAAAAVRAGPARCCRRRRRGRVRMIGSLTAMCTTQRADRDPGQGVVGGPEGEVPGVPLGGVREPGGELEDRRRDQHRDRDPLQRRAATSSPDLARRAREQLGEDGPELDQQQRHGGGAGDTCRPWVTR